MNRSIPDPISANQRDPEQCKKFLAGNRSCFYRGFWKNSPYKEADEVDESPVPEKATPDKN